MLIMKDDWANHSIETLNFAIKKSNGMSSVPNRFFISVLSN